MRGGRHRGFTLIELMITVAIVGLLATMATPLAELAVRRSRESELRQALREIRNGLDDYKRAADSGLVERAADASGYPASLELLVSGIANAKDPARPRIFFLRRIPADPFFAGPPETPPAETWGLRSYASGPDQPQPGKDVFDVYSTAPGAGLNGRPYRDW
ncbi:type II secretion system protein [Pelomonas sp. KK5]|uniref:type II secretion system protein n=1 Tax=Pelomonas sp. KK5 TaxID=1855730 RepID=UPI00097BE886|nr:type II secretion system protein [Pelomonas sp. KK5]